jgi:hypothetical protein
MTAIEQGQAMLDEYTTTGVFEFKLDEAELMTAVKLCNALAALVEEAKAMQAEIGRWQKWADLPHWAR